MAWDSYTSFTEETGVSDSWVSMDELVSANPRELINVFLEADNESGSVTDALECRVQFAEVDSPTVATDSDWVDEPIFQRSFEPTSVSPESFGFSLYGYRHYRVQVQSAGSTDDYTVNGAHRGDGVDA